MERADLFVTGLRMSFEYWLVGVGFGNFQNHSAVFMSFEPREVYAHNTYLTWSSELGIAGIALYVLMLHAFYKRLRTNKLIIISFLGLILQLNFLVANTAPFLFLYFGALLAVVSRVDKI